MPEDIAQTGTATQGSIEIIAGGCTSLGCKGNEIHAYRVEQNTRCSSAHRYSKPDDEADDQNIAAFWARGPLPIHDGRPSFSAGMPVAIPDITLLSDTAHLKRISSLAARE